MDPLIHTPRLLISLVTSAQRGSAELGWLHASRSDVGSMAWSIHPPSKTLEETEKWVKGLLPAAADSIKEGEEGDKSRYRIVYAVHRLPDKDPSTTSSANTNEPPTFIGLVTLTPVTPPNLPLPAHLTIPTFLEPTTLVVELAYAFLPASWNHGYATEALSAVLSTVQSKQCEGFWGEWDRVWMRVIVNGRNPASRAVMRKCGVGERGVFEWKGEPIFIGGEWRTEDELVILGGWVRGGEKGEE